MNKIFIDKIDELNKFLSSISEISEDIDLKGTILLNDKDFISNLKVFHTKPNLSSNIELKFVLYGKSKVELPVEITVNKGAINTSTNFHALVYLMDNEAKANITPSLFIHEKNIHKAGHGLVIKNIKPKDTIYFQSRGIDDDSAKKMLVDIC